MIGGSHACHCKMKKLKGQHQNNYLTFIKQNSVIIAILKVRKLSLREIRTCPDKLNNLPRGKLADRSL